MSSRSKRFVSLFLCLLMIVCVAAVGLVPASAEVNNSVRQSANGVFQILTKVYASGTFLNSDGKEVELKDQYIGGVSGTCFLINSNTVLTCDHVINVKDDMKHIEQKYGVKTHAEYELVVKKDVVLPCSYKNGSEQDDYAILTISQALGGKDILKLADSTKAAVTQKVYALGFPGVVTELQVNADHSSNVTYDKDDVTISEGTIQKLTNINNTDVIQHGCSVTGGNSGGPLVDEHGNVLGINKWSYGDEKAMYHYSTAIDEVKKVLDNLVIKYYEGDDVIPDDETNVEPTAAPQSSTTEQSSKSADLPSDLQISGGGQVSNEDSGNNAGGTTEAEKPKNDNTMMIIIIIAIAVLLVIIIAVVLIIILSGRKKKAQPAIPPQPPVPPMTPPQVPPYPPVRPTPPVNDGAGETSVLNDGAGETTILGAQQGFMMVRKRNGERIAVAKSEFLIGKERRRVDYCISDNNSVSRIHARIKVRAGRCYLSDMGSTNCTYVNGTKLNPNQEVVLKSGDVIRVSDEEFEFLG